jgi:hypothetical protein
MFGSKKDVPPAHVVIEVRFTGFPSAPPNEGPGVEDVLARLDKLEQYLMSAVDTILQEIADMKTVHDGVIAMVGGLRDQLKTVQDELASANVDNGRLNDIVASLDSENKRLADAVRVGTVADPAQPAPDAGNPQAPNPEPVVDTGSIPTPADPTAPAADPAAPAADPAADPTV